MDNIDSIFSLAKVRKSPETWMQNEFFFRLFSMNHPFSYVKTCVAPLPAWK